MVSIQDLTDKLEEFKNGTATAHDVAIEIEDLVMQHVDRLEERLELQRYDRERRL